MATIRDHLKKAADLLALAMVAILQLLMLVHVGASFAARGYIVVHASYTVVGAASTVDKCQCTAPRLCWPMEDVRIAAEGALHDLQPLFRRHPPIVEYRGGILSISVLLRENTDLQPLFAKIGADVVATSRAKQLSCWNIEELNLQPLEISVYPWLKPLDVIALAFVGALLLLMIWGRSR